MVNVGHAFIFAWRYARYIPEPLARCLANLAADIAWRRRGKGVRKLESNYAKVRPDLPQAEIRRLSRIGLKSYARYYLQAFTLPGATSNQLAAKVRVEGLENLTTILAQGNSAVVPLGHFSNWDLAGAYAASNIAPVLTVAEKLKPLALYEEFKNFRRSLGMEVLGLGDAGVFEELVAGAENGPRIIALLADRDLTNRGIEVDLCGERARVAAGPARLAIAADVPIVPAGITSERLNGPRRKAANTPWGIVITFFPPIFPNETPTATSEPQEPSQHANAAIVAANNHKKTADLTQKWVNVMGEFLYNHPADWHMLQSVFISDLDPARYAAITADTAAENSLASEG